MCGHDPGSRQRRHRSSRRSAGRRHDVVGIARRASGCARDAHVGDPRRRRPGCVRVRARRVRHRRRLSLRVRPPASGRDRADPSRCGWRGSRGDPAREARRRNGVRNRVERRAARQAGRARYGPRHQLRGNNWVAEVREHTGGQGVDLVVDSVGGSVLRGSIASLRYRGRCITVGSAGRDPQPFDIGLLGAGNHSLTGVFLGAEIFTPRAGDDRRSRRRRRVGRLRASSWIARSRSPRPRPRTNTSRVARQRVAWVLIP